MRKIEFPLSLLKIQYKNLPRSIERLQHAYNTLGTSEGVKRWDLSVVSGLPKVERVLAVGTFKGRILTRIEELKRHREEIPSKYESLEVSMIEQITGFVNKGYLSEADLARAKEDLARGKEDFVLRPRVTKSKESLLQDQPQAKPEVASVTSVQVDEGNRKVHIGGREIVMRDEAAWQVFLCLAHKLKEGVESAEIARVAVEAGSKLAQPAGNNVQILRELLEPGAKKSRLISRTGPLSKSRYSLEAEVKFIETLHDEPRHKDNIITSKIVPEESSLTASHQSESLFETQEKLDQSKADADMSSLKSEDVIKDYEPPAEFVRTALETDILRVVTEGLTTNSRLWFDRIHEALMSGNKDRIEERTESLRHGVIKIYVYSSEELYQAYKAAYEKIKREMEIPALRQRLTKEEKGLLPKVVALKKRVRAGDESQFLKHVRVAIEKCEREYYNTSRKQGEGKPFIIYVATS